MDAKSIWDLLSGISIGTFVAWIAVIGAIITALCTGTIKLYKVFTRYKDSKDKEQKQQEVIKGHEETLKVIEKSLKDIQDALVEQKDVNLKQIRYLIVNTCEEALEKGSISASKFRSLEELYDEYVEVFHGNGYVKVLMTKVRNEVKIVGTIIKAEE